MSEPIKTAVLRGGPATARGERRPRRQRAVAGFVPGFDDTESVPLATRILGATVIPHVI